MQASHLLGVRVSVVPPMVNVGRDTDRSQAPHIPTTIAGTGSLGSEHS